MGYPKYMVFVGENPTNMDDWGYPYFTKNLHYDFRWEHEWTREHHHEIKALG